MVVLILVLMEIAADRRVIRNLSKVVLILVLMEHDNSTLYKPNRKNFDLRGEMAATSTNKVSSLSQAHFDEIFVLVEHDKSQLKNYYVMSLNPCFSGTR